MKIFRAILLIFFVPIGSGCVSVNIGGNEPHRANENIIEFQSPRGEFQSIEAQHVDKAWKSKTTGNTISYYSECNLAVEPSLSALRNEVLSTVDQYEVIHEEVLDYNQRRALRIQAKGNVDGIPSELALVFLKKNSCLFVISYTGLPTTFSAENDTFNDFVNGFHVK